MNCLVDGCDNSASTGARGWCRRHYSRWYTKGDVGEAGSQILNGGTIEERFWPRVSKGDGCWEWTGTCDLGGYGNFGFRGRKHRAHRVSWELANGPVPDGLWVLHHCDNPKCVRPDHLYAGTAADNVRDIFARHRRPVGEGHHGARLTPEKVRDIRRRRAAGEKIADLASRFDVSCGAVNCVLRGTTWRHVA